MGTEDYIFGDIRSDVIEEFGLDPTDVALRKRVDRKINDAHIHICQQRSDWPWRVAEQVTDVNLIPPLSGILTQYSRQVTTSSAPTSDYVRAILKNAQSSSATLEGSMVAAVGANLLTLQSQWGNATSAAAETLNFMTGWLPLPADFHRLKSLSTMVEGQDERSLYCSPLEFERLKRRETMTGPRTRYYTVKPDPLKILPSPFVAVYPYIDKVTTVFMDYWRTPPILVDDDDIPLVPREYRLTLLQTSYWMVSMMLREDPNSQTTYRATALGSVKKMVDNAAQANPMRVALDNQDPTGFVQMPHGFADVRNLSDV